MKATIVFEANWEAIHQFDKQGSRLWRYLVNSGSSRSSKTFSIIQLFYLYCMANPNKKCSVFRDTKQICKQTVLEDMKKTYIDMPNYHLVKFNITESIFKFPNGSSIHIEGTDDSIKIHGYHCDVLWINEGYNISKSTFDQLDMRCKDFVILDLNPRQSHWSEDVAKADNAKLIHSTFLMNPFCPPEQKIKILSYQPVCASEVVENKLIDEKYALSYNLSLNELHFTDKQLSELMRCIHNQDMNTANSFNWEVYAKGLKAEQPNRIFKFEEIGLAEYNALDLPIYYANDWGVVDPWAVLEAKYNDGCLYLRELNYSSENEIRSKLTTTEQIQVAGAEEGLVTFWFKSLRIDPTKYIINDYNRPLKIRALRQAGYDYAIAAMKPKGSIIDGIALVNNLRVYYTSDSTNIKYEQENYSRDVDRFGKVLEEPVDTNNHHMDCVRYIATYLESRGIIRKV